MTDVADQWPEARWLAAMREGIIPLQRCRGCGAVHYYPALACPACGSEVFDFDRATGFGLVYAATHGPQPDAPVVAIVELIEGPRVLAALAPGLLPIGSKVQGMVIDRDSAPRLVFRDPT